MSVVNKMLKDLEKRQQQGHAAADYVPSKRKDNTTAIIVMFGLLLLFAIIVVYLSTQKRSGETKSDTPIKEVVISQEALPDAPSNASPADGDTLLIAPGEVSSGDVVIELDQEDYQALKARLNAPTSDSQSLTPERNSVTVDNANDTQDKLPQAVTQQIARAVEQAVQSEPVASMKITPTAQETTKDDIQSQVDKALARGNKQAAKGHLVALIQRDPRNIKAKKQLASLYFADGQDEQAAVQLAQALRLNPADSSVRLMQAKLMFRQGNNKQALMLLKAHPVTVTADDELLNFRAGMAENLGDYPTAVNDYAELVRRQQDNAKWWLGLAVSQDKQGNTAAALEAYNKVQRLDQLSPQVRSFVDQRVRVLRQR